MGAGTGMSGAGTDVAAAKRVSRAAELAHELRMPVTAILGYANLLLEDGLEAADRHEKLLVIRNHGEHLLRLVNHLLSGQGSTPRPAAVDPLELAADIAGLLEPVARAKGVSLVVEPDGPLPATVVVDEMRTRQVLINLLGNAVKFTNEGGVRLRIGWTAEPPTLSYSVVDTGIGMDEEQLARIGQPFVQVHLSSQRRGGNGLGLATCHRLARRLGGELRITSQRGRGTTATVAIPVTGVRAADVGPRATSAAPAGPVAGADFLLLARSRDAQLLVSVQLKSGGAALTLVEDAAAADAFAASAAAGGRPFAAILVDEPDTAACAAAARMRPRAGCPLIALGRASAADGWDAVLAKPLDLETLGQALRAAERSPGPP